MAVISTIENPFDRSVEESDSGPAKTRVFSVITDAGSETDIFSGVPELGDDYPGTTDTLIVKRRSGSPISGKSTAWRVTVEYGAPDPEDVGGEEGIAPSLPRESRETDPTEDPVIETGDFEDILTAIDRDLDGKPIETTAGEPYDPPIEEEVSHYVMVLEKVEASHPRSKARNYHNKVNNAAFKGFDKHTLRVKIAFQTFVWHKPSTGAQVLRYRVRYRFVENPDKWIPRKIANMGYRAKMDQTVGFISFLGVQEILDDAGQRPSNPLKIDKQGKLMADQKVPAVMNEFRTRLDAPFSALGLGS
jgi:hypothetical protein